VDTTLARLNVLGVGVTGANMQMAVEAIEGWIREGRRNYATLSGVHGVMESVRDETIRRVHNEAGLVLPDGMPLVWLLRTGGFGFARRVYGPDLMLALFGHSQRAGFRHYLYGATTRTLDLLQSNLTRRFPGAQIVGAHAPPFRLAGASEDADVLAKIDASGADIVWVGLSTPKQELWMANHRPRLRASVLIGVGAAFDFHAGLVRQAPATLQRLGLEWAFRMVMEPRRLWPRYRKVIPGFIGRIILQKTGLVRFEME
jgi:N-acetylglucosaminyldiphosphoundecaprenol N-acetyl-beta-D-mannosaminyltransferase